MSFAISNAQQFIRRWLEQSLGLTDDAASFLTALIGVATVIALAVAVDQLLCWSIRYLLPKIIERLGLLKKSEWVSALQQRLVARRGAHIVAALIVYLLMPLALDGYPEALSICRNLIEGYLILVGTLAITSLVGASSDVLVDKSLPAGVSLQFATQAAQIVIWVIGVILATAAVFDTSVTVLLSGFAGMTAVLMLIFRDSILGFVTGIQLASNDMLRIGDWIEVPQYGADGTVTDIALTTVKVQNFDKTITTVPTHALVSESFRNWRGMSEAGARRIMRAVSIDMDRIKVLDDQASVSLQENPLIRPYLNQPIVAPGADPASSFRPINVSLLRQYLKEYLRQHPKLRSDMTMLVREQSPGTEGLPIEVYAFSVTTDWAEFEELQADIIDHIVSILPEFGLHAFQGPTSDEYLRR